MVIQWPQTTLLLLIHPEQAKNPYLHSRSHCLRNTLLSVQKVFLFFLEESTLLLSQDQHLCAKYATSASPILILHPKISFVPRTCLSSGVKRLCLRVPNFPHDPQAFFTAGGGHKGDPFKISKWKGLCVQCAKFFIFKVEQRPNLWRTCPLEPRRILNFKLPLGQRRQMRMDDLTHRAQQPHTALVIQSLGLKDKKTSQHHRRSTPCNKV